MTPRQERDAAPRPAGIAAALHRNATRPLPSTLSREIQLPRRRIEPQANFRLQIKHGVALGPGKVALLELIAELGSISQAGKAMHMSYRTAWQLVTSMNEDFVEPLVASTRGGARGGGAGLTPMGRDVLLRYRAMERRAMAAVADDIGQLEALIRA